jgi:tRNA (Thr-GGU) A37 N-methylase
VFACRAEHRPTPFAVSTCKIISIDETNGRIQLEYIDAIDGTPLLDIKPYFPVCDACASPGRRSGSPIGPVV